MKAKPSPQKRTSVRLGALPDTSKTPGDKKQTTIAAAKGKNPIMKSHEKKEPKPRNRASAEQPAEKATELTRAEAIPGPGPTELAMIAAALRHNNGQDFSALARDALSLWESCQGQIQKRNDAEIQKRNERLHRDGLFANLPKPKEFPVPFNEFLKLMLSGKTHADERIKIYRHFLMDLHGTTLAQAGDVLARHKKDPSSEWDFYERAFLFKAWYDAFFSTNKSISGSKAHHPSKAKVVALERDARKERRQAIDKAKSNLAPVRQEHMMFLAYC
jgi:hypothetical protein